MDESRFGSRDRQGHYRPDKALSYPPVFTSDVTVKGFLGWLKSYLFGWNLGYAVIAVVFWVWLSPALASFESLSALPVLAILARNTLLVLLFFGFYHVRLYTQRAQDNRFKYHPEWLSNDSGLFLFRNQTVDNMIWTFSSGVPIWTAYEVMTLWAMANGIVPTLTWQSNPVAILVVMFCIPLFRELHFYVTHRLLHWEPLYRRIHGLHHRNRNPGPWSGLAMHPIEHALYFSGVLIHWVVASHPVHAVYHLIHLGLAPAAGHSGFDKVELGESRTMDTHCLAHYLHHKHFECNYVDGNIPFDNWFGTFHDGSEECTRRLRQRLKERRSARAG